MKQVFVSEGGMVCRHVPAPVCCEGRVLIEVGFSCISAGTEIASVKASQRSLWTRMAAEPSTILAKSWTMMRTKGLRALVDTARKTCADGFGHPIGYSAAGVVCDTGRNTGFAVGERVAAVGVGYANHAGIDSVPKNLVAAVPESVSLQEASTAALGCIALHGVHRLEPQAGQTVVVMGLGILGLLATQMCKTLGCRVIGIDLSESRNALARSLGCDLTIRGDAPNLVRQVALLTSNRCADGVLFTAATASSVPLSNCFKMLRQKGRFVLVGVSGMNIDRADIYAKEIDLRMATSYGVGRYDDAYEVDGLDYPSQLRPWTVNANLREYLRLLAEKSVCVNRMISGVYRAEEANRAYKSLTAKPPALIALLQYHDQYDTEKTTTRYAVPREKVLRRRRPTALRYAVVGAGSFVRSVHMPNLMRMPDKYHLKAVVSRTGSNAMAFAAQFGAEYCTTDYDEVLSDSSVDMVLISTRHNLHAEFAIRALQAGKAVFVEKPAATTKADAEKLFETIRRTKAPYMVGFNRRFSFYAEEVRRQIASYGQAARIVYTMNAGFLPPSHWTQGHEGGGRIVGEACHIVDTLSFLIGMPLESFVATPIWDETQYYGSADNASVTFTYKGGAQATMLYIANGSADYPKETMHVYLGESEIRLENYQRLSAFNLRIKEIRDRVPNKGHHNELLAFFHAVAGDRRFPIPMESIEETTWTTLAVAADIEKSLSQLHAYEPRAAEA